PTAVAIVSNVFPRERRGTALGVLAEWSAFFAATSATRTAAEAGVSRLVSTRDADDLVRQAGEFLSLVERAVCGPST
ncbi:MAG: SAV_6107 family HEPN domain-containing protein, partial [Pseudonocardiaceae bacterium]